MNKNELPSTLSLLTSDKKLKNVITSSIINNDMNTGLLYSTQLLSPIGFLIPAMGLVAGNLHLNKKVRNRLQLQNGQEIQLKLKDTSPLLDAMEQGNTIKFIADDKNEKITDYLIIPKNKESNVDKYLLSLAHNPKLFLNNDGIFTIRYYNELVHLKESKGLQYTSYLLERPYEDVSLEKLFLAFQKGETTLDKITQGHEVDSGLEYKETKQILNDYQNAIHDCQKRYNILENSAEKYAEKGMDDYVDNIIEEMKEIEEQIKVYKNASDEYHKKLRYNVGDQNPQKEKLRTAISHAFSDFYKTIKIRKALELHKHLKHSIEVLNGYTYSPEKSSDDWVLNI